MCVLLEAEVTAAGEFQEPSSSGTQTGTILVPTLPPPVVTKKRRRGSEPI